MPLAVPVSLACPYHALPDWNLCLYNLSVGPAGLLAVRLGGANQIRGLPLILPACQDQSGR